jgi:hypothetical protein
LCSKVFDLDRFLLVHKRLEIGIDNKQKKLLALVVIEQRVLSLFVSLEQIKIDAKIVDL